MREFVPVDFYEEDSEFVHVNPNVIAYLGLKKTIGDGFSEELPWTVESYLINHEVDAYYFKTKEEAKLFIKKVGGIN